MNILFVTNNLYPYLNANSEIAYKLASVLKSEYDCNVTVLGYSDKERPSNKNPYQVDDYEMKEIGKARRIMGRHESRFLKVLRLMLSPGALLYLLFPEKDSRYILKKQYCNAIRYLCKKRDVDCIVCFKNPNDTIAGAIEANVSVPIIAYELDPWENAKGQLDENVLEQKNELEKHCAAIITTMLLYSTYFQGKSSVSAEKVFCAEFPNIVQQKSDSNYSINDDKIHCVYTGQLYDDIRNPQYTLALFSKLKDNGIVLDIFGNDNGCLKDIKLPENVNYHGEVKSEDAMAYLLAADVVVNIGNTLMNQMPSKILSCVSTGKPILNIIKGEDCPTLRYMEKYPLAINVLETDKVADDVVRNVREFCLQNQGKAVDFNKIKEMYSTATPEYVGGQLYRVIKVSRSKNK